MLAEFVIVIIHVLPNSESILWITNKCYLIACLQFYQVSEEIL